MAWAMRQLRRPAWRGRLVAALVCRQHQASLRLLSECPKAYEEASSLQRREKTTRSVVTSSIVSPASTWSATALLRMFVVSLLKEERMLRRGMYQQQEQGQEETLAAWCTESEEWFEISLTSHFS